MKDSQDNLVDETQLRKDYEKRLPELRELEKESVFVLERALKLEEVRIHSLSHRIKDFRSFADKCKRLRFSNPARDMQDIVGLRVVCLYLSDIDKILQCVRREFDVVREMETIGGGTDVSSFGYMSHHVVAQMKSTYKGPRYDSISEKPFEIQIRTILMDAWANVSHHLQYKTDSDVPTPLLRDFHALSGLFYVADTHFEMFFHATQESRQKLAELFRTTEPKRIEQELNLDTLDAYLTQKFPDRERPNSDDLSSLVLELKSSEYKTIAEIDRDVDRARALVLEEEQQLLRKYQSMGSDALGAMPEKLRDKIALGKEYYSAVGMVRVGLMMANDRFLNTVVSGWDVEDSSKINTLKEYRDYRVKLERESKS